jgi:hypothetical protein
MSTTIAQTILAQLGGNRFLAMTGAKQLVDMGDGLQFGIGRGAKNKANKVVVTLSGLDLYTVTFYSIRGTSVAIKSEHSNIYADRLAALFTERTGLDTHL